MAIASRPYEGRSGCVQCGFCLGFGCEVRAKSSSLVTMIPKAVATGRCEVRPNSYVRKIETDARGRATGVKYFDARQEGGLSARESRRRVRERRRDAAVVAELEIQSVSARSRELERRRRQVSDVQRRRLRQRRVRARGQRLQGHRRDADRVGHYELDPKLGLVGGGGFDFRFDTTPIGFAISDLPPKSPRWGSAFKRCCAQLQPHGLLRTATRRRYPSRRTASRSIRR